MLQRTVDAVMGRAPFDLLITDVRIVNVFNGEITDGVIGLVGETIAYAGEPFSDHKAKQLFDGEGMYALPGFVDSHMHLESSMLQPAYFASIVTACGTTTVAADPHEIANVMGIEGVLLLIETTRNLPLQVLIFAPSTIPSAPGFEGAGFAADRENIAAMLSLPDVHGLGEVMDFNAVVAADPAILSIIGEAQAKGQILDGHASALTGRRLAAFRATGIDSDHTLGTAEKLREELALGFTVQIQESMLNKELVDAMNSAPVQDRICLVTDDVPLPKLISEGHLNHVVARAVELGLDPVRAIRFATINPAVRLRLYDVGAIAPGMKANLQLVDDLFALRPHTVFFQGKKIVSGGRYLPQVEPFSFRENVRTTLDLDRLTANDFRLEIPVENAVSDGTALVNVIVQDGRSTRTKHGQKRLNCHLVKEGVIALDPENLVQMCVFNRYGTNDRGMALIAGLDRFTGAVALTYSHDCHNLVVYGRDVDDMALAANEVISAGGGICAVSSRTVRSLIALPVAGIMSEADPQTLYSDLEGFLEACRAAGFEHEHPMLFFTIMALAVSPEIKCTDRGLLDVLNKTFLPLVASFEPEVSYEDET